MGERQAATVVAAILQCADAISCAGGYLRDLTRKALAGQFTLGADADGAVRPPQDREEARVTMGGRRRRPPIVAARAEHEARPRSSRIPQQAGRFRASARPPFRLLAGDLLCGTGERGPASAERNRRGRWRGRAGGKVAPRVARPLGEGDAAGLDKRWFDRRAG
jgi:hypothetical protein